MVDAAAAAERLRIALDLADVGLDLMRQNLRRSHADATPEQIEELLRVWVERRPGAPFGDCPGRPRRLAGA